MFRFTVRDVLWLTVVLAIGLAWGMDHRALVQEANKSPRWKNIASEFESLLTGDGWDIEWHRDHTVFVARKGGMLIAANTDDWPESRNIPMFRFTIRDVLWLTVLVALGVGWGLDRRHLLNRETELRRENSRLAGGPGWAGMDRIMDQYALRWSQLQKRERELGLKESPNPFDAFDSEPQPGDPVPNVPPAVWPKP